MKQSKFDTLWGYAVKIGTNLITCGLGTWELPNSTTDQQRQKVVLKAMKLGLYVKHEPSHYYHNGATTIISYC